MWETPRPPLKSQTITPPESTSIAESKPKPTSATDPAAMPAPRAIANSSTCHAFPIQASSFARRSSAARSFGSETGSRRCSWTVVLTRESLRGPRRAPRARRPAGLDCRSRNNRLRGSCSPPCQEHRGGEGDTCEREREVDRLRHRHRLERRGGCGLEREQKHQCERRSDAVATPEPDRAAEEQHGEDGRREGKRDPEDVDRLPRGKREAGEDEGASCVEHPNSSFSIDHLVEGRSRRPRDRRRAGRSLRQPIGRSFGPVRISRAADDTLLSAVYLGAVRARPLRLCGFRIDPVKLDVVLAAALAVGSELEAGFGRGTGRERLVVAIAGPLMASTVAVRRRYPVAAGITAALLADVVAIAWKPPNTVSFGIAWLCSVYALTVWTTPRLFALGATAMALPTLVAVAIRGGPKGGVSFTVVTLVVTLLVRRVVGDRERRAQMAEHERDLVARDAVVGGRARIARELHDVIAHHVSMIVLQAGAERRVLDGANASAGEVLG